MGKMGIYVENDIKKKENMILQGVSSESTMDSRGRFQLPAAILQEIPAGSDGRFIIKRSPEKCLTLYPINTWNRMKEKINKVNTFNTEMRRAVRYFLAAATEVKLDAKNRLLIPSSLQDYAHLDKNLLIVTLNASIEIWNPKLYDGELEDPEIPKSAAYNELTDKVFEDGKFFDDDVS